LLESSFSQGAEWKALINKYIGTIPFSGDASGAAKQSMSGAPPTAVISAMSANVGAAARHSQSAPPNGPAFFAAVEREDDEMSFASTSRSGWCAVIVFSLRL
jgi:hypothetical protein